MRHELMLTGDYILRGFRSMVMKRIQTNEIELSYEDEGDGQPVVFVHGSLSDSRNWDQHRGMITAQFRQLIDFT